VIGAPDASVSVVASLDQAMAALSRAEQGSDAAARAAAREARGAAPAAAAAAATTDVSAGGTRRKLSFKEQRELDGMEAAIATAEAAVATAEAAVADPATAANHERMARACRDLESSQAALETLYARWQELETKRGG
jgi:ATP-binding cassette subfamily F protein uup